MKLRIVLLLIGWIMPLLLMAQNEQSGFDFNFGLVIPSNQAFDRNYVSNDTVDLMPIYSSPSFGIGVHFTHAINEKFSVIFGASYSFLNHEFELRSAKPLDSFNEGAGIYDQVVTGFYDYSVLGLSTGISKVINLFGQTAVIGSASIGYYFVPTNETSSGWVYPDVIDAISNQSIFLVYESENEIAKHFISPVLNIKFFPKLNNDKGSFFFYADMVWNKKFVHNPSRYSVFGLETENTGTIAQPLTHYSFGIGYRFKPFL